MDFPLRQVMTRMSGKYFVGEGEMLGSWVVEVEKFPFHRPSGELKSRSQKIILGKAPRIATLCNSRMAASHALQKGFSEIICPATSGTHEPAFFLGRLA